MLIRNWAPPQFILYFLDFSAPLSIPGSGASGLSAVNEEAVGMIIAMGFTRPQAVKALESTVSIHYREKWYKGLGGRSFRPIFYLGGL